MGGGGGVGECGGVGGSSQEPGARERRRERWGLGEESRSSLSGDLWQKISLCFWPHCLEFLTFLSENLSVFQLSKRS